MIMKPTYQMLMFAVILLIKTVLCQNPAPLDADHKLTCSSEVDLQISVAKLKEHGYEDGSTDVFMLKSGEGEANDCPASISPEGFFTWKLSGDQVYDCANSYEIVDEKLKFSYKANIFITSTGLISRGQIAEYNFECLYEKEQILSYVPHVNTKTSDMKVGFSERKQGQEAPISLKQTTDATFTDLSTQETFRVGTKIFIATDMAIWDAADVVVQIQECTATDSSETAVANVIADGCSKMPDVVEVIKNYEGIEAGFSIKAFFWESMDDATHFNIRCKLKLCANTDSANQCTTRNCNGKRKRSIEEADSDVIEASIGPFKVTKRKCSLAESGCSHECLVNENNNWICSCPSIQYLLASDGKTCMKNIEAKLISKVDLVGFESSTQQLLMFVFLCFSIILSLCLAVYIVFQRVKQNQNSMKIVDSLRNAGSC